VIQERGRDTASFFGRSSNWEIKTNVKSAVYEIGSVIEIDGLYFDEI